jgi:hypothetical protein
MGPLRKNLGSGLIDQRMFFAVEFHLVLLCSRDLVEGKEQLA